MNELRVSDSDEEVACAAAVYVLLSGEFLKKKKMRRKRRWWMVNKRPRRYNASDMLSDLTREPSGRFGNLCRMSATDFEYLLSKIGPFIAKRDTNMRQSISIQERLAVTLRFFATGETYGSLSYLFNFSTQMVSRSVDEVCKAIIQEFQEDLKLPKNEDEWLNIAQLYNNQWNFPNCLGTIDGKHVVIKSTQYASKEFFNDKGTFSVALLALVDAGYCFTFVDIGCQDQISDGEVFKNSSFLSKLQKGQLEIPTGGRLPSSNEILPYVFLGNSAFALSRNMMKPYPDIPERSAQRIFNYRLSRTCRIVENVFGIMSSVFRVFRQPMMLEPDKVSNITLACVLLHNFMMRSPSSASLYSPSGTFDAEVDGEVVPGSWRNDQGGMTSFLPLKKVARKPSEEAKAIRDSFAKYFTTNGKLPWQDKYCKHKSMRTVEKKIYNENYATNSY